MSNRTQPQGGQKKASFSMVAVLLFASFTGLLTIPAASAAEPGDLALLESQNPKSDTVFFEVIFSLVGNGKGNYIQKSGTTNGRAFAWVAPIGGIPQGNYEPVEILIAPKQFQMLFQSLHVQEHELLPRPRKTSHLWFCNI